MSKMANQFKSISRVIEMSFSKSEAHWFNEGNGFVDLPEHNKENCLKYKRLLSDFVMDTIGRDEMPEDFGFVIVGEVGEKSINYKLQVEYRPNNLLHKVLIREVVEHLARLHAT